MSALVANLTSVPGVRGAAVFDQAGVCVEHRLMPSVSPTDAGQILQQVLVGLDAYEFLERGLFRYAMAKFADGVIGVLRTDHYQAIAFADADINPSLLTVALGALEVKLGRMSDGVSASLIPSESLPIPPAEPVSYDSLPASELVPIQVLRDAIDALAECVGPVARLLVQEQVAALGLQTADIPRSMWTSLIENLAREVPNPEDRRRFLSRVLNRD